MHRSDVLHTLDARVHARSILQHPFYIAWERGALTRAQLAIYARTYYPHVHAFPRYLEATIERTDDAASRVELQRNLADELSRPKAHHELWLDFADALGLDRHRVATAPPTPSARATVETFERLTSRDLASGLAALYAYESQQPEVSRRKMGGLRESYGVRSATGLAYFEVHATTDLQHREGERKALARCLAGGTSPAVVLDAATDALDAYWGLLDGVCDEAGVSASCSS